MIVTHIVCDRDHCTKDKALPNHLFKERKADGAGSSEDWYYKFDLCPTCQQTLLDMIFEHVRYKAFTEEDALKLLKKLLINVREG